jgi:hypothetical protein
VKPYLPHIFIECQTANVFTKLSLINNHMIYEFGAREEDILSWSILKGQGPVLPLEESKGKE